MSTEPPPLTGSQEHLPGGPHSPLRSPTCWRVGAPPRLLLQNSGTPLLAARHSRCKAPPDPSSPMRNSRQAPGCAALRGGHGFSVNAEPVSCLESLEDKNRSCQKDSTPAASIQLGTSIPTHPGILGKLLRASLPPRPEVIVPLIKMAAGYLQSFVVFPQRSFAIYFKRLPFRQALRRYSLSNGKKKS